MVKEFYAHLSSFENAFIYVRGTLLLFDVDSINVQYRFFDGLDEHIDFVKSITVEKLNHVLTNACVVGKKWMIFRNDC